MPSLTLPYPLRTTTAVQSHDRLITAPAGRFHAPPPLEQTLRTGIAAPDARVQIVKVLLVTVSSNSMGLPTWAQSRRGSML